MAIRHRLVVKDDIGERLDVWLSRADGLSLSRSHAQKLIREGRVLLNGSPGKSSSKVRRDDEVVVEIPDPEPVDAVPEDIPLDVVYEDPDVLVVNKPRGMVVHPGAGVKSGTLVNAVLHRCGDLLGINDVIRPGIVHRLDKDTTGLMVVAKNAASYESLAGQIRNRTVERVYLALVHGLVKEGEGTVEAPIGRHPVHRKRMAVVRTGGRQAVTTFRVVERFRAHTLLECRLKTGRTHQIRVHMAYIGHPVVGDPVYGRKKGDSGMGLRGQALHAWRLSFDHPRTGRRLTFTAPVPDDFQAILSRLRLEGQGSSWERG